MADVAWKDNNTHLVTESGFYSTKPTQTMPEQLMDPFRGKDQYWQPDGVIVIQQCYHLYIGDSNILQGVFTSPEAAMDFYLEQKEAEDASE